jgi:hypothetical protein
VKPHQKFQTKAATSIAPAFHQSQSVYSIGPDITTQPEAKTSPSTPKGL